MFHVSCPISTNLISFAEKTFIVAACCARARAVYPALVLEARVAAFSAIVGSAAALAAVSAVGAAAPFAAFEPARPLVAGYAGAPDSASVAISDARSLDAPGVFPAASGTSGPGGDFLCSAD